MLIRMATAAGGEGGGSESFLSVEFLSNVCTLLIENKGMFVFLYFEKLF